MTHKLKNISIVLDDCMNDISNISLLKNENLKITEKKFNSSKPINHYLKESSVVLEDCAKSKRKLMDDDLFINQSLICSSPTKKFKLSSASYAIKELSIVLEDCLKSKNIKNGVFNIVQNTEKKNLKLQKHTLKNIGNKFPKPKRCSECAQFITDKLIILPADINKIDEKTVLQHPNLQIDHLADEEIYFKVTNFSIFDTLNHICAFDTGLIEKGKELYLIGYIKPVWDDNLNDVNGIRASIGPLQQWWVSGFDGGKNVLIGVSTKHAHYYLIKPSQVYELMMKMVIEKTYLAKLVIEFLKYNDDTSYENLIYHIESASLPEGNEKFTEDKLLHYAQFITDQITNYDSFADNDEYMLIETDCMKHLFHLAGITTGESLGNCKIKPFTIFRKKKAVVESVITSLVRNVFGDFMRVKNMDLSVVKKGKCNTTQNKVDLKFHCKWIGCPISRKSKKLFYESAEVRGEKISCDDCVLVNLTSSSTNALAARVISMWHDTASNRMVFHAHWFSYGCETVLGSIADEEELFCIDQCEDCLLKMIKHKIEIKYKSSSNEFGRMKNENQIGYKNRNKFFYSKFYEQTSGRFEDPPEEYIYFCFQRKKKIDRCPCCVRLKAVTEQNIVRCYTKLGTFENKEDYKCVKWKNEEYTLGTFTFIQPDAFAFNAKPCSDTTKNTSTIEMDEEIYTEYYRKTHERESKYSEPYKIGYILRIYSSSFNFTTDPTKIKLKIQKLYRPENTHLGVSANYQSDLNLLHWSEEVAIIDLSQVRGQCFVNYCKDMSNTQFYWDAGPKYFYFHQEYDAQTGSFHTPPQYVNRLLDDASVKKTFDLNSKNCVTPLRAMDLFAGCGGLSEGFHQAGFSKTMWAVEYDEYAATAFKMNNPDCEVFNDNCNILLNLMLQGKITNKKGQILPQKGDVEFLCGGPPCQGFSRLNRHPTNDSARNKNSLILTFLSFCDYLRPRFFLLENIFEFVYYENGSFIRKCIKCLVDMGYQCTFAVRQAASFGVPQARHRFFIIAAAIGEILPHFPEPVHVSKSITKYEVIINDIRYFSDVKDKESAPYRHLTIKDAILDLPPIQSGAQKQTLSYSAEIQSHFQKMMRRKVNDPVINEHICRAFSPLIQARISLIPHKPKANWLYLPNIEFRLSDGTITNKLEYLYNDAKNGSYRGVCPCAELPLNHPNKCDPLIRPYQYNTLIPFYLVHSSNRSNNWPGLYRRLTFDEQFITVITKPSPSNQPGCVIHPDQDRVISVRECARSQGFPDHYQFYGLIADKYRQIGNAVPPPLARAIALEMKKCL